MPTSRRKSVIPRTCERQRKIVLDALEKLQYRTAQAHANILVSMSKNGN